MKENCEDRYELDTCEPCIGCDSQRDCGTFNVNVAHGRWCQYCELFASPICNHPHLAGTASHGGMEKLIYHPPVHLKTLKSGDLLRTYLDEREWP